MPRGQNGPAVPYDDPDDLGLEQCSLCGHIVLEHYRHPGLQNKQGCRRCEGKVCAVDEAGLFDYDGTQTVLTMKGYVVKDNRSASRSIRLRE